MEENKRNPATALYFSLKCNYLGIFQRFSVSSAAGGDFDEAQALSRYTCVCGIALLRMIVHKYRPLVS